MPTVYVVQMQQSNGKPKFSLDPVRQYGEPVVMLNHEDGKVPFQTERITAKLLDCLSHYTGDDYILLAGHPAAIALAAMLAAEMSGGRVRLLSYNKQEEDYEEIVLDLDHLPEVVS